MIQLRKSKDRGYADHGWLRSFHTFSFADYYDPAHMGHSVLRVINQDWIAPGAGFPMHAHKDMEIVTYVTEGSLEHKDTLGSHGQIQHGEIQQMSAGTGIRHSEYNPDPKNPTQLLQIWILPDRSGHQPKYQQVNLSDKLSSEELVLIASPNGENNSLLIHQNAKIFAGKFTEAQTIQLPLCQSRHGWIQWISGEGELNKTPLRPGDAVAMSQEETPHLQVQAGAHFLFFDLP